VNVELFLLAGMHAAQVLAEVLQRIAAAHFKRNLILLHGRTLHGAQAFERQHREIAILYRPRIFVYELCLGMAQFLYPLVDVFVRDWRIVILHRQTLIILQLDLRHDFEFGLEAQRLAGLQVHLGDIGLADHFQVLRLEPVVQILGDQALQHLFPDVAGKMLANDRRRRLAGPETRQLRALLDRRHRPARFGLYFLGGHGNLQRVLATFH
jgi:hypothetical protein